MPRSKPLSIGGKPFEIQKAAQFFIQELLNSQPLKVAIPYRITRFSALLFLDIHAPRRRLFPV